MGYVALIEGGRIDHPILFHHFALACIGEMCIYGHRSDHCHFFYFCFVVLFIYFFSMLFRCLLLFFLRALWGLVILVGVFGYLFFDSFSWVGLYFYIFYLVLTRRVLTLSERWSLVLSSSGAFALLREDSDIKSCFNLMIYFLHN